MSNHALSELKHSGHALDAFGLRFSRYLADELKINRRAAETLLLLFKYGMIDREGMRKSGILKKGEDVRRTIALLIDRGYLQEAKLDTKNTDWRQRSVWVINPEHRESLQAAIERANSTYQALQRDCHGHLSELASQPLNKLRPAEPIARTRKTHTLQMPPEMPDTVSVQFNLRERRKDRTVSSSRAPALTVRLMDGERVGSPVKQRYLWNWTDTDLAEAQAQAIVQSSSAWSEEYRQASLADLQHEFSRRGVSFVPLTIHQVLAEVALVLDSQASSLPPAVRLTVNKAETRVAVGPRQGSRGGKAKAPWERLILDKKDFADDITTEDLVTIACWYALFHMDDPSTHEWDLDHARFD